VSAVAVTLISRHQHQIYGRFDHVLMLRDSSGLWGFPGGPIGDSESPERGARRLVLEQTGFRVDAEMIPCNSEDENCAVFSVEVEEFKPLGPELKPQRTELHDNDMWVGPCFAETCSPSIFAPGVIAALKLINVRN
jgi:8-oxo-dGTP pyrophosphatase MutT (NUDIX family)